MSDYQEIDNNLFPPPLHRKRNEAEMKEVESMYANPQYVNDQFRIPERTYTKRKPDEGHYGGAGSKRRHGRKSKSKHRHTKHGGRKTKRSGLKRRGSKRSRRKTKRS